MKYSGMIKYVISIVCMARLLAGANGSIRGRVVDLDTQVPLAGANVIVENLNLGAATDMDGFYTIYDVPPGLYHVIISYIGYESHRESDVVVKPGRISFVNAELRESVLASDEIVVRAGHYDKSNQVPAVASVFNREEIRRAPGSIGDVSRVIGALPSTAQVADNSNDLMVRGGSPTENAFYVDGIRIPNINHFPIQGSTGGPIGLINTEFIEEVTFYPGGFTARYGYRLSSVIDMKFRDGNREETDLELDLNSLGFGVQTEGPLPLFNGSWFVGVRNSYLNLIKDILYIPGLPRYHDLHAKMTLHPGPRDKVSLLNIYGGCFTGYDYDEVQDYGMRVYGDYQAIQNTSGITWKHIWKKDGYSKSSLSYYFVSSEDYWWRTDTRMPQNASDYYEGTLTFRQENVWKISAANKLNFGFEVNRETANYDYFFNEYTNRFGDKDTITILETYLAYKAGAFVDFQHHFSDKLNITVGLRGDYFTLNENITVSPRFAMKYYLDKLNTLRAYTGVYYQYLNMYLLSQHEANKKLRDPRAVHYGVGYDRLLTADTKLSIDVYYKTYHHLPLDPDDPYLSLLDQGSSLFMFGVYGKLVDTGKAWSGGVEILIQKKLAENFYGLISGSWFRTRYQDYSGVWRDRTFDNRFIATIVGGWKPNNRFEISARWNYMGGVPYTPFDVEVSKTVNAGVIDTRRIHEARTPDYHTLNLRVDRRFNLSKSSFTTYLSVWNVYNRENIALYYWDTVNNEPKAMEQLSLIPQFGIIWHL